jgi:SAM-dependent methyltransferase
LFVAALPLKDVDEVGPSFFGDPKFDRDLPKVNEAFWAALINRVQEDGRGSPRAVLDVGCHTGGLLETLANRLHPTTLMGIEPVAELRVEAVARLADREADVTILPPSEWDSVPSQAVDLLVSHEMLYLEANVPALMRRVHRVLRPDGAAYIVLGCHAENPLWTTTWKPLMIADGHAVYDHLPMDILAAASDAGLTTAVRPLRRSGWIAYDARHADFPYPDVTTMFEHHYRQKLLFRLEVA